MTDNLELQMDAYLPLRDVVFQTLRGRASDGITACIQTGRKPNTDP